MKHKNTHVVLRAEADDVPRNLVLDCAVTVEAAADEGDGDRPPKFSMVAYTGAPMRLAGFFDPVVVSLEGLRIPSQTTPVRFGHRSEHGVGHTKRIAVEDGKVVAEGVISRDTEAAREVVASGKRGFPWKASIGASADRLKYIKRDESVAVNGQELKGPLYVAEQATLGEISFVDLAADSRTRARIAAEGDGEGDGDGDGGEGAGQGAGDGAGGGGQGGESGGGGAGGGGQGNLQAGHIDQVVARARAEATRRKRITEMTAELLTERPELADDVERLGHAALEAEWPVDRYQLEVMRLSRSYSGVGGPRRRDSRVEGEVVEAALCIAGGLETEVLEKQFPEQTLEAASRQYRHGLGLCETLLIFAQANGYHGYGRSDLKGLLQHAFADITAAGFSTLSLPGILSNVANKFLRTGFEAVESTWREIAAIRSVRDFKQVSSYSLTGGFVYQELPPGGELEHATVGEQTYNNQARTYGRMFGIDRRALINDDLDALTQVPRRLGRGAALKLNEVFWKEFLNNGSFFTSGNNNFADGAGTALGIDSLTQAEELFLDQTDPDGHPLAVAPVVLLVPNALFVPAAQIMNSTQLRDTTASKKFGVANPHAGKFRPVRSSYLSNASYSGSSSKAWYLLADPMDMPVIEVAFLNGRQQPTVESADADFNVLGIQMRGYHDFGVAKQEPRGGVKMKGEA